MPSTWRSGRAEQPQQDDDAAQGSALQLDMRFACDRFQQLSRASYRASASPRWTRYTIQRRAFHTGLQHCSLLAAGPALAAAPVELLLLETRIAGSHYYQFDIARLQLLPGSRLRLQRQPHNRHDPRTLEVWWWHLKLGYLSRADNAFIAQLLDRGVALRAGVDRFGLLAREWEPLGIGDRGLVGGARRGMSNDGGKDHV